MRAVTFRVALVWCEDTRNRYKKLNRREGEKEEGSCSYSVAGAASKRYNLCGL